MSPLDHQPPRHPPLSAADRPDPLEHRLRASYLAASERLDPATAGRLRAARRTALQAAGGNRASTPDAPLAHRLPRVLLPASAFAVAALATLVLWQPARHPTVRPTVRAASADVDNELPPDTDSTDPAMYQNLDFYGWLAANDTGKAAR